MHSLSFTLNLDGVTRMHDAVLCLAKFSDTVSLEARSKYLSLTALNTSRSAYASVSLDRHLFFERYTYSQQRTLQSDHDDESRFTCQILNKALLSVFKGRLGDMRKENTAVERCEVSIQDQTDTAECRMIVKMMCRHGVTKTYRLTYEAAQVEHALFDPRKAKNSWSIRAIVLRSFSEYFGANTEQLDIFAEDGRVVFTSYTDKIMHGKEILKHPLETSIALATLDFEHFSAEEKMHIAISVKDFRAIVLHADTLGTSVRASYSFPTRPLRLAYNEHGMQCEFTLMTIGDYRGTSTTPAPVIGGKLPSSTRDGLPTRQVSAEPMQGSAEHVPVNRSNAEMPPPSQPASRSFAQFPQMHPTPEPLQQGSQSLRPSRPSPPPPKASLDPESLFLPTDADDEDERQWDEANYDDEEETVGWDASANHNFAALRHLQEASASSSRHLSSASRPQEATDRLPPTQRLSEIETLFSQ